MVPINPSWSWTRRGIALGLACTPVTIAGCSTRAGAERVPPPPVVAVVEARRLTVPIMAEPIGTTRALQEVSIRARVRGFLKEICFKEGGDVEAGQLLFVIEEEPFRARVAAAKAGLAEAEANLKKAHESRAREVAKAQVDLDKAVLDLNRVEEARQLSLAQRKMVSAQDVDRAVAVRKRSEAQVEADKASLEQAKADFETSILTAEADVEAARARLHEAEIDLGYCRMSSPIDGRIGLSEVKVGNLVGPATGGGGADYTELAVVRQLDPMGVDIQVASRYLDRVASLIDRGLAVEVFRPGLEGEAARRYAGKATVIDNTINPTTSTFLIRAEVANASKSILPGEYVKADAKVGEARDAIVVPEQAVVESQAGPTVYTVDKQGKVAVVPVRASLIYEGLRVLESGLEPGQEVIVEGMQLARAGMTVKTRPASPESLAGTGGASASPAVGPAPNRPDKTNPKR